MPISKKDYLGSYVNSPDLTPVRLANMDRLLTKVNKLQAIMLADGVRFSVNTKTKSNVGGSGNGGFRSQNCPVGAPHSAHKDCLAVDIYDPDNKIDAWLNEARNLHILEELGMYFEAMIATPTWSHWSIHPPKSGRRFFLP